MAWQRNNHAALNSELKSEPSKSEENEAGYNVLSSRNWNSGNACINFFLEDTKKNFLIK